MYERVCIVAEVGSNHNGDLATALACIRAAKRAGADVVKFQLFTADGLAHPTHAAYDTLRRYALPRDWLPTLKQCADDEKIGFAATPFDLEAVDLLDKLDVPFIKIASGDLTYHDLIRRAAATGKPLVISTGAATRQEAYSALMTVPLGGASAVCLLHCVVAYPALSESVNLAVLAGSLLPTGLRGLTLTPGIMMSAPHYGMDEHEYEVFTRGYHVGFSDHTLSLTLPAVAVGLGARVIEKHFTTCLRTTEGPDHAHSLTPPEFRRMVEYIREAEAAMGGGEKKPLPEELPMRTLARRGWYARRDLPTGHVLAADDLLALRPVAGIPVEESIAGCRLTADVTALQPLSRDVVARG